MRAGSVAVLGLALGALVSPTPVVADAGSPERTRGAPAQGTEADRAYAELVAAHEAYALPRFYARSRRFLARYPRDPRVTAVRRELALQLVAENLLEPDSSEAEEARRLLAELWRSGESEAVRFEAALALAKFSPEAERLALARRMISEFPRHAELEQVFVWMVTELANQNTLAPAAELARDALSRWPTSSDRELYLRVIERAGLIGAQAPFTEEEWAVIGRGPSARLLLVDFWATWCRPCIAGHETLRVLRAAYPRRELEIVDLNLDRDPAAFARFRSENVVPWISMRPDDPPAVEARFGVDALPAVLLIDPSGVVLAHGVAADELAAEVARRIGGPVGEAPALEVQRWRAVGSSR